MRVLRCSFAIVAVSLLATGVAQPINLNPAMTSSLEADGLHLTIGFDNNGFGPVTWPQMPSGVDLYRRSLGLECGDAVRVTDAPIPWSWNDQAPFPEFALQIQFVDPTTADGTGYRYEVRAVDGDRNPIAQDPEAVVGFATHGEALLGHGSLLSGGDCGLSFTQEVEPCPNECFPAALVGVPDELAPYFNTGQTFLLYGSITGVSRFFCNTSIPQAVLTRGTPSLCVVGVAPMTWTEAKRLYR